MRSLLRQVISILLMPVMVVAAVPYWLLYACESRGRWSSGGLLVVMLRASGVPVFLAGLALFTWCVMLFARVGKGTLAPWDPTHALVSVGPYRYVRNPMITGVALMLLGEALLLDSWAVGSWFVAFLCINHVYFVLSEEPGLSKRFGESYEVYKEEVPRWVPRRRSSRKPK